MQRWGDHNQKNRSLWEETQRLGGNKYREIYKQLKHMNIYKISQGVNNDYDTYDSAIVVAHTDEEARTIHPDGGVNNITEERVRYSGWALVKDVRAELVGVADERYTTPEVLLASYNAG